MAFTVYAAMRKKGWHHITVDHVKFSVKDIRDKLIPVLKESEAPKPHFPIVEAWAKKLVEECKSSLGLVLPFKKNEIEFLERLQKLGEIKPELLTDNADFCERVERHPLLHWRARQFFNHTLIDPTASDPHPASIASTH